MIKKKTRLPVFHRRCTLSPLAKMTMAAELIVRAGKSVKRRDLR